MFDVVIGVNNVLTSTVRAAINTPLLAMIFFKERSIHFTRLNEHQLYSMVLSER